MTIKTYASKASARKGAKRQNIDLATLVFTTDSEDRWYWKPVGDMVQKKKPVSGEASVAVARIKAKQVELDKQTLELYGVVNCPNCKTHLENGVGSHGDEINGTVIEHEEFDKCCLGCGWEFGNPLVKRTTRKTATGKGVAIEKDRPTQNGVTRKSVGSKCDFVWVVCDNILENTGSGPTIKQLRELFTSKYPEHNVNNAAIELYRWRRFNGLS